QAILEAAAPSVRICIVHSLARGSGAVSPDSGRTGAASVATRHKVLAARRLAVEANLLSGGQWRLIPCYILSPPHWPLPQPSALYRRIDHTRQCRSSPMIEAKRIHALDWPL